MKIVDPTTNWAFDLALEPDGTPPTGGLNLRDIRHDGHNFAKDVRLIGLWLETETVETNGQVSQPTKKLYVLDKGTFTTTKVEPLTPMPTRSPDTNRVFQYLKESDEALEFSTYFSDGQNHIALALHARYEAPTLLAALPNCVHTGITIEQIFLFSRYSNVPKHEPSGGLSAARFHPMTKYQLVPNPRHDPKQQHTRVRSIRFDYRLYLYIDRHYDSATNAGLAQIGNQAGVFADSDSVVQSGAIILGTKVWNIRKGRTDGTPFSRGTFVAVEKPLVLELTAPGLASGFPVFTTRNTAGDPINVRCWDNVHWWGSRGPGEPLISTPGAFHCAHLHWRWGAAAKLSPAAGDPRFEPRVYPSGMPRHTAIKGMWGPVVDPKIWIQTVKIAVTKHDPRLDPLKVPAPALTTPDWKTRFIDLRATPLDIYRGEDIVLWYSSEVGATVTVPGSESGNMPPTGSPSQTYTSANGGTIFMHGMFFAHDAEKTGLQVGSTDPAHRPSTETAIRQARSWIRTADQQNARP